MYFTLYILLLLLTSFVFRLQDIENEKHLRASEEMFAIEKTINDIIQSGEEKKGGYLQIIKQSKMNSMRLFGKVL